MLNANPLNGNQNTRSRWPLNEILCCTLVSYICVHNVNANKYLQNQITNLHHAYLLQTYRDQNQTHKLTKA